MVRALIEMMRARTAGPVAPAAEEIEALTSESLVLSGNDSNSDLTFTLDVLSTTGDFTLKVITEEGVFFFHFTAGKEFSYSVLSDNEFSVTYTSSDCISKMLSELFDEEEILDIHLIK